jgi:hypothetical protein
MGCDYSGPEYFKIVHCTLYGVTNLVTDVTKRVTREESLTREGTRIDYDDD